MPSEKQEYRLNSKDSSQGYTYIPAIPFPFLAQLKNREEFEGGLEKGREKGEKLRKKRKE